MGGIFDGPVASPGLRNGKIELCCARNSAAGWPDPKRCRVVALFAGLTEGTLMGIVLCVTAEASRRQNRLHSHFRCVAPVTIEVNMCTRQRKFRLPIMIEPPQSPAVGIVT